MEITPFTEAYRELNDRFLQLVDHLSALRDLSALDVGTADESQLLRGALRVLMEHEDLRRCSVFLLQGDILTCAAGLDWRELLDTRAAPPAADRPVSRFRLGEGLIGQAARTGALQRSDDCLRSTQFATRPDKAETDVRSLLCAPIPMADQVLGVVNISHPEPGFFTAAHERLLQVFAGFLGQMLANWRHLHAMELEVRRRTGELEAALAEAEALKHRYRELSIVDELTGIHNRRFFYPEASAALARATRHDRPFSLMMLDLDHFKQINDRYGHDMGDKVLQATASMLKAQTRDGDVIARFGGEEFVLALPDTDERGARQLAERIVQSVRAFGFPGEPEPFTVTATVGLTAVGSPRSVASGHEQLLETLLRQADEALYRGKKLGRDRMCSYDPAGAPPE